MNIKFLSQLLETPTPSGCEHKAKGVIKDYLSNKCEMYSDALGNIYAALSGSASKSTILLEAHIDNIGFQVSYIDEQGFIYVRPLGGVDITSAIGQRVVVVGYTGKCLQGVIGKKAIHLQTADERKCVPEASAIWIDLFADPDTVRLNVRVGDFVAFISTLLFENNRLMSFGLDNKVGAAIVCEVTNHLACQQHHPRIVSLFAVQEEIGCKGAQIAVANSNANLAICIDVCHATDVPEHSKKKCGDIQLGQGVVIMMNTDSNPIYAQKAIDIATAHDIPYQLSAATRATGGTDAPRLQLSGHGITTLSIGIPNRYMHTNVEMCDYRDVDAAINLIVELIKSNNE